MFKRIGEYIAKKTIEQDEREDTLIEDIKNLKHIFDLRKYVEEVHVEKKIIYLKRFNYNIEVEVLGDPSCDKIVIFHHGIVNNRFPGYKYAHFWNKIGYRCVIYDGNGWGRDKKLVGHTTMGKEESNILFFIKNELEKSGKYSMIGVHGESMGAGTLFNYMKKYSEVSPFDFYVCDSGFIDFKDVVKTNIRWSYKLPDVGLTKLMDISLKAKYGFGFKDVRTHKHHLDLVKSPVLAIHSKADKLVPYSQMKKIQKWMRWTPNWHFSIYEETRHVRAIYKYHERYTKDLDHLAKKAEQYKKNQGLNKHKR